jgi:pimeloyl-ACP methyl ester carboxylesterase
MLSYRGYGLSTGSANEKGIKVDCEALVEYLNNQKQIAQSSLILYGRSLGGAVALHIASSTAANVKGIILENTFLSIPKLIPR